MNLGGTVNYEPNRYGEFAQDRNVAEPPLALYGAADRYDHRVGDDYYSQPGALFRLMNDAQKQQLFKNIAAALAGVPEDIQRKQIEHFTKAIRPMARVWQKRWTCVRNGGAGGGAGLNQPSL